MSPQSPPAYGPDLVDLCKTGAIGGLTDRELLDRYTALDDTAASRAFEVIVRRHGPMVLGLCRRALADEHAAEDAFQAAFLALTLKARQIRNRDSLGAWLHAVALRVSRRARATRRHRAESPLASTAIEAASTGGDPMEASELRSSLDEEIDRLPAAYRWAVILCYFQGKTQDDAARELGWTKGTVSGRLARAKDLLRSRLTRRGLAPSAALAAASLSATDAAPAVPAELLAATVRAATGLAVGRAATITASGPAIEMAAAVLRSMTLARLKSITAAILLMTAATVGMAQAVALHLTPPQHQEAESRRPTSPTSPPAASNAPLPRHAIARLGATHLRHDDFVSGVAFSPDGRTLASSSWDGTVRFWNAATGEPSTAVHTLRGDPAGILSIAYSPDGSKLVFGTDGGWVYLRDLATNRWVFREKSHSARAMTAFAPDGQTFATTDLQGHIVSIRDAQTGRELRKLTYRGAEGLHGQLAYSRDGKRLASGVWPEGNRIAIWNLEGEADPVMIRWTEYGELWNLEFAPDGALISCGNSGRIVRGADRLESMVNRPQVQVWDASSGRRLREFDPGSDRELVSAGLTLDGKTLVSVLVDRIQLWDYSSGKITREFAIEPRSFGQGMRPAFEVSPDGKTLVSSRADHAIHAWSLQDGRPLLDRGADHASPVAATLTPDGSLAATGDHRGKVSLWELPRGVRSRTLELGRTCRIRSVLVSPDGKSLAAVGESFDLRAGFRGILRVWDVPGFAVRHEKLLDSRAFCVAFSGDSRRIAVGCGYLDGPPPAAIAKAPKARGGELQVLDTTTGQKQAALPVPEGRICTLAFTRDGQTLVSAGEDAIVRFWDISSKRQVREIAVQGPPSDNQVAPRTLQAALDAAVLSPDLATIATVALFDDRLLVWGFSNGRVRRTISVPSHGHTALAFSPDGRRLASAIRPSGKEDAFAQISIWGIATKRELLRLEPKVGRINSLAFSADGKRLVSGQDDTTAIVWDVSETENESGRPGE